MGHRRQVPKAALALARRLADEPRADQESALDLSRATSSSSTAAAASRGFRLSPRERTRLSPTVRVAPLEAHGDSEHSARRHRTVSPRPLVTGTRRPARRCEFVAAQDARVVRGAGDSLYAVGIDQKAGNLWYIYRPGAILRSYGSGEILGYEMRFLGTASVEHFGEVSTMLHHLGTGGDSDRRPARPGAARADHQLCAARAGRGRSTGASSCSPTTRRRPAAAISSRSTAAAQDGLDTGSVLAIYHAAPVIADPRPYQGPDVISKLVDQTRPIVPPTVPGAAAASAPACCSSSASSTVSPTRIVLNTTEPIVAGDIVRKP